MGCLVGDQLGLGRERQPRQLVEAARALDSGELRTVEAAANGVVEGGGELHRLPLGALAGLEPLERARGEVVHAAASTAAKRSRIAAGIGVERIGSPGRLITHTAVSCPVAIAVPSRRTWHT